MSQPTHLIIQKSYDWNQFFFIKLGKCVQNREAISN